MHRRKYKKEKSSLSSKIWKIGVGVLILFLIVDAYLLATSRIFNIKSVNVVLDKVHCTDEDTIKNEASFLGKNFFLINNRGTQEQIKDKHFCIKSVKISGIFPDKIKIEVSGREAVAIISLLKAEESSSSSSLENIASSSSLISKENIGDEFLVDSEGVIFSKASMDNVPRLYFWGNLSLGKKVEEKIVENSLVILAKLKVFDFLVRDAKIFPGGTLLINPTNSGPRIIFTLHKNIEIQLASLQLILTQAKIDMQEMEFIDLRYDKPVVKYAQKKKNNE